MFKTTCLNSNGRLFAGTVPTVIGEPEPAFDTQKRGDPKRYAVISHTHSMRDARDAIINLAASIRTRVVGQLSDMAIYRQLTSH